MGSQLKTETTSGKDPKTIKFRPDIEGLRAIAIGSVLLFHAGIPVVSGGFAGVDTFFVISGFLITSLIVREVGGTGRLSLSTFWARRARRLLPASALVLLFSAWITYAFLPLTDRRPFGGDIISAALYFVNWRLAGREVDYLAEHVGQSPVQHYWSLAVEEQFYIVLPLLVALIVVLFRKSWKRALIVLVVAVTVASFAWALHASVESPASAFFVSTTRAWELGVGSILALAFVRVSKLPAKVLAVLGWIGLVALVSSFFWINETTLWPNLATLAPVLGTAALIASGARPTAWSPSRILGTRPAVWLGALSYSIYLWHWPILIAGHGIIDDFTVWHGVVLSLLSVIPAWLSHKYVENPIRHGASFRPNGAALKLGAVATAFSIVAGGVLFSGLVTKTLPVATSDEAIGAAALLDPALKSTKWSQLQTVSAIKPAPLAAPDDLPDIYNTEEKCRADEDDRKLYECDFGDLDSDRVLAVVGDSKIVQWLSPIEEIAKDSGWKVTVLSKSACAFTATVPEIGSRPNTSCHAWGEKALNRLLEMKPEFVLTSQRESSAYLPGETEDSTPTVQNMAEGIADYWDDLEDAGIEVVTILDNLTPEDNAFECVAENPDKLSNCAFDKEDGIKRSGSSAQLLAADLVPEVDVIDLNHVICPEDETCPAVIGNVLLWRQGSHITDTYARTAEVFISDALHRETDGRLGEELSSSEH